VSTDSFSSNSLGNARKNVRRGCFPQSKVFVETVSLCVSVAHRRRIAIPAHRALMLPTHIANLLSNALHLMSFNLEISVKSAMLTVKPAMVPRLRVPAVMNHTSCSIHHAY
jgi:hypothetical protein